MKCPVCGKEMELVRTDSSFNNEEKEYKREVYVCKTDDAWLTTEIPRKVLA